MKEPKEILVHGKYTIKLFDESDYTLGAPSHVRTYEKIFTDTNDLLVTSQIGVALLAAEELKSSCLIGAVGCGTLIHPQSALLCYNQLIICCSNTVFKLTIPELDLVWKTVSDTITCLGIHQVGEDYIVHGELEITKIDKNGNIIWQLGGRDIWTTAEGTDNFAVYDDHLLATDWQYNTYKIDFDGNILTEYKATPNGLKNS